MIAIDTSALIAIHGNEPERRDFVRAIGSVARSLISAGTVLETSLVLMGRSRAPATICERLDRWLARAAVEVVSFDAEQMSAARAAFLHYGKGRHPAAALNFGDCISYALAKTHGLPLLYKGEDFAHTDLEPALPLWQR